MAIRQSGKNWHPSLTLSSSTSQHILSLGGPIPINYVIGSPPGWESGLLLRGLRLEGTRRTYGLNSMPLIKGKPSVERSGYSELLSSGRILTTLGDMNTNSS